MLLAAAADLAGLALDLLADAGLGQLDPQVPRGLARKRTMWGELLRRQPMAASIWVVEQAERRLERENPPDGAIVNYWLKRDARGPVSLEILDASGRVAPTSRVFGAGEVVVMTTVAAAHPLKMGWKEAGAEVVEVSAGSDGGVYLPSVLDNLGARGWIEVYCEGGAALATSLLKEDFVDRLELHRGPVLIGGDGIGLGPLGNRTIEEASRWRAVEVSRMDNDVVTVLERDR